MIITICFAEQQSTIFLMLCSVGMLGSPPPCQSNWLLWFKEALVNFSEFKLNSRPVKGRIIWLVIVTTKLHSKPCDFFFKFHSTYVKVHIVICLQCAHALHINFAHIFAGLSLQVSDSEGREVPSQVNVWWDHRNRISTAKYEVRSSYNQNWELQH